MTSAKKEIPEDFATNLASAVEWMETASPREIAGSFYALSHGDGISVLSVRQAAIRDAGILIAQGKLADGLTNTLTRLDRTATRLALVGVGLGALQVILAFVD